MEIFLENFRRYATDDRQHNEFRTQQTDLRNALLTDNPQLCMADVTGIVSYLVLFLLCYLCHMITFTACVHVLLTTNSHPPYS